MVIGRCASKRRDGRSDHCTSPSLRNQRIGLAIVCYSSLAPCLSAQTPCAAPTCGTSPLCDQMAYTRAELQGEASAALVNALADMLSTAVFVTYEQVGDVRAAASHHGPANDLISL